MSNKKLITLLATMKDSTGFVSRIVKDCISHQSDEWAKGFVAGFSISFTRNKEDLFSPEYYQSEDPDQYASGHLQGQSRGHEYQEVFLKGLTLAGILQPAANNNRKEEK